MKYIGVTGHQNLSSDIKQFVAREFERLLAPQSDLVGVSSLAVGADQLFAQAVLSLNGKLNIVVPSESYESTFKNADDLKLYKALLSKATVVTTLPFTEPSEEAFMAAGLEVVRRSDSLIAVWDGQSARGKGGTADIVKYAETCAIPVTVIWPPGKSRN